MAKEKRPAMPLYVRDILADEHFRVMSLAEKGAYMVLLMYCWQEGSIPESVPKLSRLCDCSEAEMEAIWPRLRPRFAKPRAGARLIHRRLELARIGAETARLKRVEAAKIGAAKMLENRNLHSNRSASCLAVAQPIAKLSSSIAVASSYDDDVIGWMQRALADFMGGKWGVPDREIAALALRECNGAPWEQISAYLVDLHRTGAKPSRSWAWFETMLSRRFGCQAQ